MIDQLIDFLRKYSDRKLVEEGTQLCSCNCKCRAMKEERNSELSINEVIEIATKKRGRPRKES